jgi:general secretion pathway protein A
MLSNLETSTQKLIQIVLVGQPEFEQKLNLHALRQLKQRIVIRSTISPLTEEESLAYIHHRLALAKAASSESPLFTQKALQLIVKVAQGTPRVLNILCTNALISGFGYQAPRISARIAKEVIADYTRKKSPSRFRPWLLVSLGVALLAVLFWFSPYREMVVAKIKRLELLRHTMTQFSRLSAHASKELPAPTPAPELTASRESVPTVGRPTAKVESPPMRLEKAVSVPESPPAPVQEAPADPPLANRLETPAPKPTVPAVVRTVKKGEHISKLAIEVYGVASAEVLEWIRKHNPQLHNINRVEVGAQVVFPQLPTTP